MPSVVATTFREAVASRLDPDRADLISAARGSGPEHREISRALMLGDRAAREWAASAFVAAQLGAPSEFETLDQLGKPEDAAQALDPTARRWRKGASSPEQRELASDVVVLADSLQAIDTEMSAAGNHDAFVEVGRSAAAVLLGSAHFLGGADFVEREASRALDELVALDGWTNQLGPRFA